MNFRKKKLKRWTRTMVLGSKDLTALQSKKKNT